VLRPGQVNKFLKKSDGLVYMVDCTVRPAFVSFWKRTFTG